ncbi:MAG: hypothetical protein JWQ01_4645 [Massilia sp.]|nr:hypothetical protein [Massilia sp.]
MAKESVWRQVTTLRTVLAALVLAAMGVWLLYCTSDNPPGSWFALHPGHQAVVREVGALLITTVALYLVWELVAKRSFVRELRAEIELPIDLEKAGVTGIAVSDFGRGLDWQKSLDECSRLDMWVSYASTWRNSNRDALQALASRNGAAVRVFLPDPDDAIVVSELASRYAMSTAELEGRVREGAKDFEAIFRGKRASFQLWYLATAPVFSFYRFDNHAYMSFYKHRRAREYAPPTIVITKSGTLWEFLRLEIEAFTTGANPLGRRIV